MKIEVKHRRSGSVLFSGSFGSLRLIVEAAVGKGADLTGAHLTGAHLTGAYLTGVYLTGADGVCKQLCSPLCILLDQVGKIRAYKLVTEEGYGPIKGGIEYRVGEQVSVDDADTDDAIQCAPGINLATLDWCLKEWREGYRVLVVEFGRADIACIPIASDGKFRVHRCRVVREIDLASIGWPPKTKSESEGAE